MRRITRRVTTAIRAPTTRYGSRARRVLLPSAAARTRDARVSCERKNSVRRAQAGPNNNRSRTADGANGYKTRGPTAKGRRHDLTVGNRGSTTRSYRSNPRRLISRATTTVSPAVVVSYSIARIRPNGLRESRPQKTNDQVTATRESDGRLDRPAAFRKLYYPAPLTERSRGSGRENVLDVCSTSQAGRRFDQILFYLNFFCTELSKIIVLYLLNKIYHLCLLSNHDLLILRLKKNKNDLNSHAFSL